MRPEAFLIVPLWNCFNPRTYMRCDDFDEYRALVDVVFQSTHLHEVRPTYRGHHTTIGEFQSTHLHEVRQVSRQIVDMLVEFQSTHLHEVRLLIRADHLANTSGFNPRTYMRCDLRHTSARYCQPSFNPRTYMRCDNRVLSGDANNPVSIHAPT